MLRGRSRGCRVRQLCVAATVHLSVFSGCAQERDRPPDAEPSPKEPRLEIPAHFKGFAYAPTLLKHAGTMVLAPVAEIGGPTGRQLYAVVAVIRDDEPRLALWTFEQSGQEDVLAPTTEPTPLDADDITRVREAMAAPRAVVFRPQGLDVAGPKELVAAMREGDVAMSSASTEPLQRVIALATLTRGLGDERWLDSEGARRRLRGLSLDGEGDVSKYRAQLPATAADGSAVTIAALKKREGWVLESIRPRKGAH